MAEGAQNGVVDTVAGPPSKTMAGNEMEIPIRPRMNDLPDEIVHITQGFVPVALLVSRMAQVTHNSLQEKIAELAKMPVPASAVNGNSNHTAQGPDDVSAENLRKKATLLNFAQDMHAKWVKVLVILEWSRNSARVSKLIDLKFHLDQQRILFDAAVDDMVNVKRDLTYARMPSPDLKTALQVLSTGNAPWIPDLGYIDPPALTADEKLKWINDLDTLLSLRLNIDDYDKIPPQFRDYEIGSGRVTFKVAGEFEVELTIADEDFEKQFWFIDFRYSFGPSAATIPDSLRTYLEACVNDVLSKDGLAGCYKFLHEFVLTSKINELKRQALELSKTSWSGTLVVEPLNRALAIQYWSSRTAATGHKNWVLIAIDSGKKPNAPVDAKTSSRLIAKWYRDNKEVKDAELNLDVENLSAEALLKDAVGKHIEFILTSIRDKLLDAPRFKRREASMNLHIDKTDPAGCSLTTEVGPTEQTSLIMEPTTGVFAVKPQSKFSVQYEMQLNNGKGLAEDGVSCLENIRCSIVEDALNRRGTAMGWFTEKPPLSQEEFRSVTKVREWARTVWISKQGWGPMWHVAVILGLSGDEWWLMEVNRADTGRLCKSHSRLPLSKGQPDLNDTFWSDLASFATGMIAQTTELRELQRQRIKSLAVNDASITPSQRVRLPFINIDLAAMVPSMGADAATPSWANNVVSVRFRDVQAAPSAFTESEDGDEPPLLVCTSEAILRVRSKSKFTSLNGAVDRDLSFDPVKGEFSLRIRHKVGEAVFATLRARINAIDRFASFLEAVDKSGGRIVPEDVTLQRVSFRYGKWRMALDLSRSKIEVSIDGQNPHLRVLDLMRGLVNNSSNGIAALLKWLPISLPALEALATIEAAWDSVDAGTVQFAVKTLGWTSVRYTVVGKPDTLTLEVQSKQRQNDSWWHVWRSDKPANDAKSDLFTAPLNRVWGKKGKDETDDEKWKPLGTGGAGKPDGGVIAMMLDIDDAIRNAVCGKVEP